MALREVAIAARDFGPGRAKAGDIITVREPLGHIGAKEKADYLWLLIDESELPPAHLIDKTQDEVPNIPLAALVAAVPSINLENVQDSGAEYQPFVNPRKADGKFQAQQPISGVRWVMRDNRNSKTHQQRLIAAIRNR